MGNSSISLQTVVDGVATIGDLTPVLKNTGGYADEPALTIGNVVMRELISVRFPWKWNRMKLSPFLLNPLQQDYASVNLCSLGWLESAVRIDINNTQVPPPSWKLEIVRDIPFESMLYGGFVFRACWMVNDQMEQGAWPGPGITYQQPLGKSAAPTDGPTNILDANNNILVLTKYGTTGLIPPAADPEAVPGTVINDGSCQWTVCNPQAQGFRFAPRPPSGGNVWLMRLFGQRKAPLPFTRLGQTLDPIPDDYAQWFEDGFIAYAHRYSSNPTIKARFEPMRAHWLEAVGAAAKQGDREEEGYGFYPDRPIAQPSFVQDPGPYPYRWGWG